MFATLRARLARWALALYVSHRWVRRMVNPLLLSFLQAKPQAAAELLVGFGVPGLTARGVPVAQIAPFLSAVADTMAGKAPAATADKYVNLSAKGGADALRWLLASYGLSDPANAAAVDAAVADVLSRAAPLV
jgi:hypothetical protein